MEGNGLGEGTSWTVGLPGESSWDGKGLSIFQGALWDQSVSQSALGDNIRGSSEFLSPNIKHVSSEQKMDIWISTECIKRV